MQAQVLFYIKVQVPSADISAHKLVDTIKAATTSLIPERRFADVLGGMASLWTRAYLASTYQLEWADLEDFIQLQPRVSSRMASSTRLFDTRSSSSAQI